MRFVYAPNIRLHYSYCLKQTLQHFISYRLPLLGLPLPFLHPPLQFLQLSLPVIHQVHVFIYYPGL